LPPRAQRPRKYRRRGSSNIPPAIGFLASGLRPAARVSAPRKRRSHRSRVKGNDRAEKLAMTRLLIRVAYRSTGWNQSRRIVLRIRARPVAELARSEFMVSRNNAVDHEEKMGSQCEDSPVARYRVSRNALGISLTCLAENAVEMSTLLRERERQREGGREVPPDCRAIA